MRNILPVDGKFSENQFSVAMEHSPIGTALVSLEGSWLWANREMRRLLGYSLNELLSLTFQDVTHPDDMEIDLQLVRRVISGDLRSYCLEKRYIRKDGSIVPCELTVALVRDATTGEPRYFISQVKDNTAKLAAAAERTVLMERVSLATRTAGVGIWEWDLVTNSITWDAVMYDLYGASPGVPLTLNDVAPFLHPEDHDRVVQELEAAAEGALFDTHFRINRQDGEVRHIRALGTRLCNGTDDRGRVVGTNWDITASRRLQEEAMAASQAKTEFLAMMSHEIRTPLNGVLGMVQAMAASPLPDDQRARLDIIRQSGNALLMILNDVLDVSKIEAGKLTIEAVEFDLDEVVAGAKGNFEDLARQKDLTLDLDIGEASGVYRGDPTRLRQILSNLVSNALKFTEQGGVNVSIARDDKGLKIQVRDTGIGIAPDNLASVFQKFKQADASTTRRFGGTGLGLAICHELVGLMGGAIGVESQPGQGTVFTVTLPLERVGAAKVREPRTEAAAVQQSADLRVLAAEDNAVNRLVLTALLGQVGVCPVIVENGAEAVEAWATGDWDVILMDVQMPVMDGPTAAAAIRRQEAATGRARTPIIALTANAMSHQVAEYLAAGMDGHVAKPIEAGALFAALETALDAADERATRAV